MSKELEELKLKRGAVVYMKGSSGLIGYGNPQCVSWYSPEIGELSLFGHNEHYHDYDVDKIVEDFTPKQAAATPATGQGMKEFDEPKHLIKAGDPKLLLNGRPPLVDCRVIAEDNYQLMLAAINKRQSPQPDKEPESQREELTMIADVLQIAREDLQYKIAHNVAIDLFKDFQLLNEVRSDVLLIRDRFEGLSYSTFTPDGRLKVSDFIDTKLFMELKTKSTPTSAKTDKEIEELAEVYVPISKDEVESVLKSERYINGWTYGNTVGWLKPIRIPAAMIEMHKAK